jgi:hypothetical protein
VAISGSEPVLNLHPAGGLNGLAAAWLSAGISGRDSRVSKIQNPASRGKAQTDLAVQHGRIKHYESKS